jgi:hypothetical protein
MTFAAGCPSVLATAWPVVARAQQPVMPVIGYLGSLSADDEYKNFTIPFLQGLKEAGYVEGQNVAIEYRWAENQYDRLPALVAGLVRRRVAVIAASDTPRSAGSETVVSRAPPQKAKDDARAIYKDGEMRVSQGDEDRGGCFAAQAAATT